MELGELFLGMGYEEEQILSLCNNPYLEYQNRYESLYTICEENNYDKSIQLIRKYLDTQQLA